jgi:hypothetical protein
MNRGRGLEYKYDGAAIQSSNISGGAADVFAN